MAPLFHVVLHQPEIPNNTGNIGRTCVALGCALHLVRPLAFDTSVHALRRAGLDYWPRLAPTEHDDWASAVNALSERRVPRMWLYSTKGAKPHWDADFRPGDALVFGSETRGLPDSILDAHPDRVLCLPMVEGERSLNLATAVCAAVCEGVRQCVQRGDCSIGPSGRLLLSPPGR